MSCKEEMIKALIKRCIFTQQYHDLGLAMDQERLEESIKDEKDNGIGN